MTVLLECCRSRWKRCSNPVLCLLAASLLIFVTLVTKDMESLIRTETVSPYVKGVPLSREDRNLDERKVKHEHLQVEQHQNGLQTLRTFDEMEATFPQNPNKEMKEALNNIAANTATANSTDNSLNVAQKTNTIVLCIPCLNFDEVRDVAILMKSILLNTKSWMDVWFVAKPYVIRTLNVLFNSWDIAQMAGFRVEQITASKPSMDSLNEKCSAVIKEKFLFLLPELIFAEDISKLWASNDTLTTTLKSSWAVYNQAEKDSDMFPPDLLNTVYSVNGDSFRVKKEQAESISKDHRKTTDLCDSYKRGARLARRRHICFYCYPGVISNTTDDVTMFTQVTFDRLYVLAKILENWEGPASIALHLSDWEAQEVVKMIEKGVLPGKRANVQYHVVFRRGNFYPMNILRNIALNEVRTRYFFVLDGDFVPQPGLHSTILSRLPLPGKRALVVPAFETQHQSYEVPSSKERLVDDFFGEKVRQFQLSTYPQGHAPVNYRRWIDATFEYPINYQLEFEPYVVLARNGAPQFAEVLVDRLRDKVEYMYRLNKTGYRYTVLHDGFIVHFPHPAWKGGSDINRAHVCRDVLVKEIHEEWVIPT